MPDLRVREIKDLLVGLCPGLLHELVPGLKRCGGNTWQGPNPTRGEAGGGKHSFTVWGNGAWREYDEAEDVGKGDVLGLVAYLNGHAPRSTAGRAFAIRWAKQRLGLDTASPAVLRRTRAGLSAEAKRRKDEAERAESAKIRRHFERALAIWTQARPDDAALARYFTSRGIDLLSIPHRLPSLRLHPALDHWAMPHQGAWRGPAMVARVVDGTGQMRGVHCTWLRDDFGGRPDAAVMPNAKLMLGQIKGGIVPLTRGPSGLTVPAAIAVGVAGPVGLGEGIESTLAIGEAVPELRLWACLDLGKIAHAPIDLACVSEVVVLRENDAKPQAVDQAAKVLAALAARGKPVTSMWPTGGNDFADMMGNPS